MRSKNTSLYESYKITLELAGSQAHLLKKSYLFFIISYIFQGLTFLSFFPFLENIFSLHFNLENTLLYLLLVIFLSCISLYFRWLASEFQYSEDLVNISHELRLKLGKKIKNMPLKNLYQYRTGELNSILAQNVDDSVLHMGIIAGMFFEATVVPLVIIIGTFFISTKIALSLVIVLIIAIPIYRFSRKETKWEKEQGAIAHAKLEADTIEYIQGLPILKALNQVGENAKTLQKSIEDVKQIQKKGVLVSSLPLVIMNTLIEFVFLSVLIVGSLWITQTEFSISALISLLIILSRLSEPLANFLAVSSVLDIMENGFINIKKILKTKELKVNKPNLSPLAFNINFENVFYSYDNSQQLTLNNISLEIKEKTLNAIVGPSGSGKTTISKMIMRYADPQEGKITISDIDIKSIETKELMSYISVVFQDVYLFDDTIFNNIKMGKNNATKEEVIAASKAAYCEEFINKLPNGYETKVGEIGGNLSGGEKQRISIARAILKDTPIVILDEPTSALDTESEIEVQKALDQLIKNKTVIAIAHRLSTINHSKNIIVLENGQVVETGTHKELIEKKGKYYNMYETQEKTKQIRQGTLK